MPDAASPSVSEAAVARLIAEAPLPVVAEFRAPWCGTCRLLAPSLQKLARAEAGRLAVVTVNLAEEAAAAARHGVTSLPTTLVFREGAEAGRIVGLRSHDRLTAEIAAALG